MVVLAENAFENSEASGRNEKSFGWEKEVGGRHDSSDCEDSKGLAQTAGFQVQRWTLDLYCES